MKITSAHYVGESERLLRAARRLYAGERVDSRWIRKTFGVSFQTAMRDMQRLRLWLPVWAEKTATYRPCRLTLLRRRGKR